MENKTLTAEVEKRIAEYEKRVKKESEKEYEYIDHPSHYGGKNNPYEAIKVINAWQLNFSLGSVVKYLSRAGKKPNEDMVKDLKKARFYIDNEINRLEQEM